ncbi:MAG: DUF938 domain-containing protein [Rhodospirillaceae bacterium]|nr:DUF938 domain-containing protein [Rhodospirillaceae bacterium]
MPGPDRQPGSAGPAEPDGACLDAPAFHRNHGPIAAVLARHLDAGGGHAIEIGSGTGQHALAFARAFPRLTWWPTDVDPRHLASIDAWRRCGGAGNLRSPVRLDASGADWGLGGPGRPPAGDIAAVIAINVIHIAPWAVAEGLVAGARSCLVPQGLLVLYGPFTCGGAHTAPSNAAFDAYLSSQDPAWGVRDLDAVAALAAAAGLPLEAAVPMPANNLTLVFRKAGRRASAPPG